MLHETGIFLEMRDRERREGGWWRRLLLSMRMINATQSYWTTPVVLMTPRSTCWRGREGERERGREGEKERGREGLKN